MQIKLYNFYDSNNRENHAFVIGFLFVKTMRILIKNLWEKRLNNFVDKVVTVTNILNIFVTKQRPTTFSSYLIFNWLENDEKKLKVLRW